jgi:hypothetical protein
MKIVRQLDHAMKGGDRGSIAPEVKIANRRARRCVYTNPTRQQGLLQVLAA